MDQKPTNQGEGDRESAKRYNRNTQEFIESGKVKEAAKRAGDADPKELADAEKAGKERAQELDPAVERDYSKPTK